MRLFDYKTKFLALVAENLRRLAEFISRRQLLQPPEAEEEISAAPALSPREDWLEKTRAVASENWFDFSAVGGELETIAQESEFETEIQTTDSTFSDKTGASAEDFVLRKPEKQTPVKTFFENRRKVAGKTPEISDPFEASDKAEEAGGAAEIPLTKSARRTEAARTEKTGKSKSDSRFLSFGFPDKKKREEISESPQPLKPLSESSGQTPPAKDEKSPVTAKRNFRLSPLQLVSKSEPEAFAPKAADAVENQPPKLERQTFERKKSAAIKFNRIAPAKPKNAAEEKPESIVGKPPERRGKATDRQPVPGSFPVSGFGKTNDEPGDAGINFEFPKRKTNTDSASVFLPKAEPPAAPETPNYSSPQMQGQQQQPQKQRRKNRIRAREYFNPERDKKTDNRPDNTEKFALAAALAESPWIDLPDETAFTEAAAADDIQTSLFQREHLLFLEGEQAGKT